jgi:hypothetical protein
MPAAVPERSRPQTVCVSTQVIGADGVPDIDPGRIYFIGQSQGAIHGTILSALEPSVAAAVLNVPGGSLIDILRWTSLGFARSLLTASLASRTPALTMMTTGQQHNYVLRHQPARVKGVPGAIEAQNVLEMMEWIQMPGDAIAYAPDLRASTLPGVPLRRVLFQHSRDDPWIPNPQGSALVRAANMQEWSVQLRCDIVRPALQAPPPYCHLFLTMVDTPGALAVAVAAQQQAMMFFSSTANCPVDQVCLSESPTDAVAPIFGRDVFEEGEPLPESLGLQ